MVAVPPTSAATGAAGYGAVDVLDEDAVSAFVARVAAETGRLDVSFNVSGRGDVQGTPLPLNLFVVPSLHLRFGQKRRVST